MNKKGENVRSSNYKYYCYEQENLQEIGYDIQQFPLKDASKTHLFIGKH